MISTAVYPDQQRNWMVTIVVDWKPQSVKTLKLLAIKVDMKGH